MISQDHERSAVGRRLRRMWKIHSPCVLRRMYVLLRQELSESRSPSSVSTGEGITAGPFCLCCKACQNGVGSSEMAWDGRARIGVAKLPCAAVPGRFVFHTDSTHTVGPSPPLAGIRRSQHHAPVHYVAVSPVVQQESGGAHRCTLNSVVCGHRRSVHMRSEGASELARGNRATFLRATIASAATLAAFITAPKEAPALGEFVGTPNASFFLSEQVPTHLKRKYPPVRSCSCGTAPTSTGDYREAQYLRYPFWSAWWTLCLLPGVYPRGGHAGASFTTEWHDSYGWYTTLHTTHTAVRWVILIYNL